MKYQNREDATRGMLASDAEWPQMLLPLKNTQRKDPDLPGMPLTGFVAGPGEPVCIVIGNIFGTYRPRGTEQYPTIEAAMQAGWVVD